MKTSSQSSIIVSFSLFVAVLTAIGISGGMSGCSGGGGGSDKTTLYIDSDSDGYGSDASDAATIKASLKDAVADSSGTVSLTQDGVAYVNNATDCNDSDENINPAMADTAGDGTDQNCDGADDEAAGESVSEPGTGATDDDGDGYTEEQNDCDDTNAAISPAATETDGDGVDSNCDGEDNVLVLIDVDGDGVVAEDDCDDNNAAIGGKTIYYADTDSDTFGNLESTLSSCDSSAPTGYSANSTDCNDSNATIYPGATETADDGIDQDCNDTDKHSWSLGRIGPVVTPGILSKGDAIEWDGSAIWNGIDFEIKDPSSSTTNDCEDWASYINKFSSYLSNVTYEASSDNTAMKVTFDAKSAYNGYYNADSDSYRSSADKDYEYSNYYTAVAGNKKYFNVFSGSVTFTCDTTLDTKNGGGKDGYCVYNESTQGASAVTVDLESKTGLSSSELAGMKAFILLKGFSIAYEDGKYHQYNDGYAGVSLASETPDATNDVKISIITNFDDGSYGSGHDDYEAMVSYTIVVYNPDYVAISKTTDDSATYELFDSMHSYDAKIPVSMTVSSAADDMAYADFVAQDSPIFVGFTKWGYDNDNSEDYMLKRIYGHAVMYEWDKTSSTAGTATIDLGAAQYRHACKKRGTVDGTGYTADRPEMTIAPNQMELLVVACKDNTVCRARTVFKATEETSSSSTQTLSDDQTISGLAPTE